MPGTALDAIHPWPDFCPWVQTAPVWASCLLWSPRSPLKVSKMFHWCVFFAAHTEEMTVWHLEKRTDTAAFTVLFLHWHRKSLKIDFIFSPQFFFFQSLEKHKVAVFPNLPWSMWLIQAVKKEKKVYNTCDCNTCEQMSHENNFSEYLRWDCAISHTLVLTLDETEAGTLGNKARQALRGNRKQFQTD